MLEMKLFYKFFINFIVKPSKTIYEKDNSSEMFEKFEKILTKIEQTE